MIWPPSPRRRACPGLDPGPGPNLVPLKLGPGLRRDDARVLSTFTSLTVHDHPLPDGIDSEARWMEHAAADGRAQAHVWQGEAGWSVPRSYTRAPAWSTHGHALQVRDSGGGLVPQGPGLTNLTLVFPTRATPAATDAIYRALCAGLQSALAPLGLTATTQAVEGSFCDGRYNLAVDGRKIAGTAQAWRRIEGRQIVLAHAVLIVDADIEPLTAAANALEEALGQTRRYRAGAVTSVARAWCARHGWARVPQDFAATVRRLIAAQFMQSV